MIRNTVAYCGLFCESCGVYIATINNDQEELERIATMMKTTKEEIVCKGCRSDTLSRHCRNCFFKQCARNKKIDFCEECKEFPCVKLIEFQKEMPHRAELFESARYRKENGLQKWLKKMEHDYSCPVCGYINSPYYKKCKNCNAEFGNIFVRRNLDLLRKKE